MPPQDRRRLNDLDRTEQARPQQRHPYQQCAVASLQLQTRQSPPQGDVELMTEAQNLGFKSRPRLEQVSDKRCKQPKERDHQGDDIFLSLLYESRRMTFSGGTSPFSIILLLI